MSLFFLKYSVQQRRAKAVSQSILCHHASRATINVVRSRLRVDTDIVDIVLGKGVTEDPPS